MRYLKMRFPVLRAGCGIRQVRITEVTLSRRNWNAWLITWEPKQQRSETTCNLAILSLRCIYCWIVFLVSRIGFPADLIRHVPQYTSKNLRSEVSPDIQVSWLPRNATSSLLWSWYTVFLVWKAPFLDSYGQDGELWISRTMKASSANWTCLSCMTSTLLGNSVDSDTQENFLI